MILLTAKIAQKEHKENHNESFFWMSIKKYQIKYYNRITRGSGVRIFYPSY